MTTEFRLGNNTKIVGKTQNTRNGFRHLVEFYRGNRLIESRSVSYLNRTWESYNYETAIKRLLEKMVKNRELSKNDVPHILDITAGKAKADLDAKFGSIAMVAKMGEVLGGQTKKEKNAWKLRMLKAGLGEGLKIPSDWDSLSEDEKGRRLDKMIEFMNSKK